METPLKTSMEAEGLPPKHKEKHRQEPLIFGVHMVVFGGCSPGNIGTKYETSFN